MKAMAVFGAAVVVIVLGVGALLAIPFASASDHKAIEASAAVAVVVQLFGFAVARAVPARNFMAGWVIGTALRFVALAAYALVAVKLLGLPAPAALLSLVTFFFISTLVEPKLLTI
jgi:hypothetical protein